MVFQLTNLRMFRDAVIVAVVAVLTVQGLRRYCGDRYLVPSDSMQPVLYGDPVDGDVVFVDKMVRAADRRRGDLVVVESPQLPNHQLVKRIAASGDDALCWIDIQKGDVWLGENAQQMRRDVKDPRDAMSCSVTWAVAGDSASSEALLDLRAATPTQSGAWMLPPMARGIADVRPLFRPSAHKNRHRIRCERVSPAKTIGTLAPVDASFLDQRGARVLGGDDVPVADCGMQLSFRGQPAVLLLSIDSSDFATTFMWSPERDHLQVWLDGRVVSEQDDLLGRSWSGDLKFGRLDGRDYIMLGGDHQYVLETPGVSLLPRPRTWLHVGVVGEEPAVVRSMRVFRDVYAYRDPVTSVGDDKPWPKFVRPGHWFLLGDNAFDSRDSRHFGDVATDDFLGVPVWVIGPWARARALPR